MTTKQIEHKKGYDGRGRRNAAWGFVVLAALLLPLALLRISRAAGEPAGFVNAPSVGGSSAAGSVSGDNNSIETRARRLDNVYPTGMMRGRDGQLYGAVLPPKEMTINRAGDHKGKIFRVNDSGEATVLHTFTTKDGSYPQGDLLQARDGYLYGVTREGAKHNLGAIFRIQPDGSGFALLHEFDEQEGGHPLAGLVENHDGNFYGTTTEGGAHSRGTVYRLTPDGRFNVLHSFNLEDGANPMAALTEGSDGAIYSVARMGGHKNRGVIYKLSADGRGFTILHSFDGTDGANPEAELVNGTNGFLYGVASHGGVSDGGIAFRLREDGSDFAVLHEFEEYDLEYPDAPGGTRPTAVLISSDGYLYGTTRKGGEYNQGVAFRMRLDGSQYAAVHSFSGYGDKQLMQDTDGRIVVPVRESGAQNQSIGLESLDQLTAKAISLQPQGVLQPTGTVFTVTNAADSGPGSLRQAIIASNNSPGKDEIDFFIFGSGAHKIAPAQALPDITDPVIIDGLTQPGASNATWPPDLRIEIDGFGTFQESGLSIDADNCLIRGLVINRFRRGIAIGGNNNQIKCNFIGTDPLGIFDRGNVNEGIAVFGDANIIGGATPAERNLISGNDDGLHLQQGHGNLILGNYIGTNVFGNTALGNEHDGISIVNSSDNQIGGTAAGARNIISGNGIVGSAIGVGVNIVGDASTGNTIVNNFIGTNSAGNAAVPNTSSGMFVGSQSNSVGATDNLVGGTGSGARNVISGNSVSGVTLNTGNQVLGNYLGVDATGSTALSNGDSGIGISGADNQIGGTVPAARNIISGNRDGIRIFNTVSTGNVIEGNYIGTDATGAVDIGNTENGLLFRGGSPSGNLIGGTTIQARNFISGNGTGISFGTVFDPSSNPTANLVQGNHIGLSANGSPLGNSVDGILIRDHSHNNVIGGTVPGAGNTIANNGDGGIHITRTPLPAGASAIPTGNSILGNSIFSNFDNDPNPNPGLGIDLNQVASVGGDGVTQNDLGDVDTGPNSLQNFPVLTPSSNGTLNCSLNSTPNRSFRIEFFANTVADPSGYGEGEIFIGSQNVTTDPTGNITFTFTPPPTPGKPLISATATDNQTGDTSEFSLCVAPCSAPNITSQPTNQTACEGSPVTFSVTVSESGASFQWRRNTVNIAGATSSTLTLNSVTSVDAASYDVIVSHLCGTSITSSAATLTVSLYALAPTSASYPATGGTGNFNISVAGSCSWTAVSNDSWITITAPAGAAGAGNSMVGYSVAASSGGRTGTITVAGKTFTVTQAAPTAINLIAFAALSLDDGVLMEWQTGFEVDNLGFNLYRDELGKQTLVNPQLIGGSALTVGKGVAVRSGFSYRWWDAQTASKATRYWLEAVDLDGQSTWHGPYLPEPGDVSRQKSVGDLNIARTLSNLGNANAPSVQIEPLVNATSAKTPGKGISQASSILASSNGVKIAVKEAGLYRLTQPELVRSGLDEAVDPRTLRLFVDGREQAILVRGEADGRFDTADAVEFYGLGTDSPFTAIHNYFLIAGTQAGQRISFVPSLAKPAPFGSFAYTTERRDRSVYFPALLNGERENFFGAVLTAQPLSQSLTVNHLAPSSTDGMLEVALQGVANVPHNVTVRLNGTTVGYLNFDNQASSAATFSIDHSLLVEGQNTVTLQTAGNPADISLVDYLRLTYQHQFAADQDALRFTVQGGQTVTIDGFTDESIRVFDVTDAAAVHELKGLIDKAREGFNISLQVPGIDERTLLVLTDAKIKHPNRVSRHTPLSLRLAQTAQFVIITHNDLLDAALTLKSLREAQGLSVAVVDVEDIFDEFSFGQKSPYAMRDFLDYARKNWRGPLRYVLFLGDASYDARNYLGVGELDLVPTRLIDTTFLEAATDEWFGDFDQDGIAELAIGRLPARNKTEAEGMIKKLTSYEKAKPSEEVLGVADFNDGFNFEEAIDRFQALVPGDLRTVTIKRGQLGDAAKPLVIDALNRGQKLVSYSGHGSVNLWQGNLLTDSDAALLQNRERLSVFLMMNCLNGYFADPLMDSLAEALLKSEGGAVAAWASTALTFPDSQTAMNQELYRQLFADRRIRIGDAVQRAKAAALDTDVRQTWVLFADPTMRLR